VNELANLFAGILHPETAAALFGCGSAFLWGFGDFSGGMGVRAGGGTMRASLKVICISHTVSLILVTCLALGMGSPMPHGKILGWGISCGVAGAIGLMCFYVALAEGSMGPSAAISGLLAAGLPSAVTLYTQGAPSAMKIAGFLTAAAAIWMIAAGSHLETASARTLTLAMLSGVSFGIFFLGLKLASPAGPLWAMACSRIGSASTTLLILLGIGFGGAGEIQFSRKAALFALGTVFFDTAGNMMFIASTRLGRLDVAAVLASLYPASTILLASIVLREHPTRRQMIGMAVALVAVVMITL
jgi:drug/metabolite transporter (DMT)-like permease